MASGSGADARDAELAALSGEKLVDLLRNTYRRADFDAVARVLKARDRRFAEVKAALAEVKTALADIDALRKNQDARRRPRDEAEEMAPLLGISSSDPVHRDEPRVEELEDVPLSRPMKRLRQCEASALESEKMDGRKTDGQRQSNSVSTLGNYGQKSPSAKSVHSIGLKARIGPKNSKQGRGVVEPEKWGGGMPRTLPPFSPGRLDKDSKQGRGVVEPEKWGGGMPRTLPPFSPGRLDRSVLPKGSSQSDHGRGRIGKKQSSSDGILGPPPKGIGKIINTSMMGSSSRSANKDTGTVMMKCPPLCRQTEDSMIGKGGNPIQETRMVASPSLSIGSLTGAELRAYCLKPGGTPPASCLEISPHNFRDSAAKGGNGLSKKPVDVSSKK